MSKNSEIFLSVDKNNYQELIGITADNANYYKIAFINDGSGIITRGVLYRNTPYWIECVDELPETQKKDTIYLITK